MKLLIVHINCIDAFSVSSAPFVAWNMQLKATFTWMVENNFFGYFFFDSGKISKTEDNRRFLFFVCLNSLFFILCFVYLVNNKTTSNPSNKANIHCVQWALPSNALRAVNTSTSFSCDLWHWEDNSTQTEMTVILLNEKCVSTKNYNEKICCVIQNLHLLYGTITLHYL